MLVPKFLTGKTLFWDLDGTLLDPERGIIDSYMALLHEVNHQPMPKPEDLKWVIGPPLRECLAQLFGINDAVRESDQIELLVTKYRRWYVTEGYMYRDTPYPFIKSLLSDLKGQGVRMFVATAKAHSYASLLLKHWQLDGYFEAIHGSELDGTRANKAELLRWMLERYHLTPGPSIVMIGDRKHDIIAAKSNHLASIGVGYGYGSEAELRDAGADQYCRSGLALRTALLPIDMIVN